MAVVSVAAGRVPSVLEECSRIGLRHIHLLTAGFKEIGTEEGKKLDEQVASISREKGLLVIGPNGMGPYSPSSRLTAWGAIPGVNGPVGIISQSGGIAQRFTEIICSLEIGVEKAVSFGNATVLDCCDFLEFMAGDEKIKVIAMYLEGVRDGRRFFRLAKEVNRKKPIILWKGGESEVGARTAASHTGAMVEERRVWDAFFSQTGVIRVRSMEEWADAIITLALLPPPEGNGVFLVGGGGGNSVANSDTCIRLGLDVPRMRDEAMESLRKRMPVAGSIAGNPLDSFRTFQDVVFLKEVLELGYKDPSIAMIIVDRLIPRIAFHLPDMSDSTPEAIEFIKNKNHQKPTIFTVDTDGGDPELSQKGTLMRTQICKAGIPAYPSFKRAAKALVHHYRYHTGKQ